MPADDWSSERIRDRLQIQQVLFLYCRAIDRLQPDLLAEQFHADALVYKGPVPIPIAEFVPDFAVRHARVPQTSHMVTNVLIDFLDADRAFVESWGLAVEHKPAAAAEGPAVDHVYRVRYADIVERRDDRWRIAERTYVIDHVLSAPVDAAIAPEAASRIVGLRSDADPVMHKRRALGLG